MCVAYFKDVLFLIFRFYFAIPLVVAMAIVTYIKINRSQALYQKSLVKCVKKVKRRKQEFINEQNKELLNNKERKYNRAIKKLENRIKKAMLWNKNIVINRPELLSEDNLALPNNASFTFINKLDALIQDFNTKHKRHKTVNSPKLKKSKAINSRSLSNEEISKMQKHKSESRENTIVRENASEKTDLLQNVYSEEDLFIR